MQNVQAWTGPNEHGGRASGVVVKHVGLYIMLNVSCPCEGSVSGCHNDSSQHRRSAGLGCRIVPDSFLAQASALQPVVTKNKRISATVFLCKSRRRLQS